MATKSRLLSRLIEGDGSIKTTQIDSDAIGTSAAKSITAASGTDIYSSADTLPVSADNGDQALVTSTNRLYIYSNGGWYNIALINSTPYWITEADGSYALSTTGGATIIEILAGDSDGTIPSYTATTDSDFNQIATITQDSDSRWIVIPIDSENGTAITGTGTITFKATDGVNLVSTLSTFNLTFISTIENSNYTTLLAKADTAGTDNQVDASANNHTITESGSVISTALSPYHPGGYSTYFDGTDDHITGPTPAAMAIGTGNFTIECWFYATSTNTNKGVWDTHTSSGSADGLVLSRHTDTTFRVYATSQILISGATTINNAWVHLAVVRDGTDLELFVNGVSQGTTTWNVNMNSSTATVIGGGRFSGSNINAVVAGYIRDFRIVKSAVYTSAFTPPTESLTAITNTVLLACSVPYNVDVSASSHTLTPSTSGVGPGSTSTARFGPYDSGTAYTKADYGGSLDFQAASAYMAVDSGAITSSWGNNFTVEFWLHRDTLYDGTIFDNRIGAQYPGFFINAQSNGVAVYAQSWLQTSIGNGSDYIGKWAHYALTFSGTQGKSFVNGKLTHTYTIPDTATYAYHRSQNTIGAKQYTTRGDESLGQYKARLADFRISTVLRYTTNFTPPTTAFVSDSDTLLLTCTNKNNIWDAGAGTLLTKAGNTTASNTQRKFATSSAIYFDGTGDYLSGNDMGLGGANAFTIEAWMYPTVYNTYANDMYSHGANLSVGADFLAFGIKPDGNVQMFKGSGSPALLSTSAPCASLNQWYHIAFVRESNNNTSAYVNGVLVAGPTAISGALTYAPTGRAFIGTQSYSAGAIDRSFEGYIQDVRITNGLARYTSAFTPPTAEFEA